MKEKVTKLRFGGIYSKTEHSSFYVPLKPSPEAQICLSCDNEKCNGDCKRFREELKKLKEQENER